MKLYVGNLPWSIDDRALKELFTSYGEITEAVLIKDKFSGRSKGFGFISDEESGKEYFVHASGLIDEIREDDKVTFELTEGKKGLNAVDVKLA